MKPNRHYAVSLSRAIARPRLLRGARGALVAISMLLGAPVFGDDAGDSPAIPPGQENLLLEILGPGAPLPDCELVDGQVEYTVIKLTYACSGGEIEYELVHRSQGGRASARTAQFAITLKSGSPPRGFADAFVSLIRAREAEVEWVWPDEDDPQ